jgi:hypothetical protein
VSSGSSALRSFVEPADVYEWTARHVADDAEALFIGGNGFRAAGGDSGSSPNADDDARSARRLREAMQVVLILLPAEIVVWLVSIA